MPKNAKKLQSPKQETHKIVMVGPGGVGKTSLTLMYLYGDFTEEYDPTKADSYRKETIVDGQRCIADILDTAGQEEYSAIRDAYYSSGEGFLLVFDLTRPSTLDALDEFHRQILRVLECGNIPMVLVGNKNDLESKRAVTMSEAATKARQWGCKYIETSAKDRQLVEIAYEALIRLISQDKERSRTVRKDASAGCRPRCTTF